VVTIHNGIDLQPAVGAGAAVRSELGLNPEDQVAIMVSALRQEKAHDVALEALRLLRPRLPRLRLVIVGEGEMRASVAAAARDLGDRVVMTGFRADVMALLDAADVCLHPSRREALPSTIIEAMAAGVPVIATDTGGIPELLKADQGSLIPAPPEPEALAQAMHELLSEPDQRRKLAGRARKEYERRLTAGPWVRRTRGLYDEILAERAGGRTHTAAGGASRLEMVSAPEVRVD
jgi:glycosyltransferase involved in cell wall biosynthesis